MPNGNQNVYRTVVLTILAGIAVVVMAMANRNVYSMDDIDRMMEARDQHDHDVERVIDQRSKHIEDELKLLRQDVRWIMKELGHRDD